MADYKRSSKNRTKLHRYFGSVNVTFSELPEKIHITLANRLHSITDEVNESYKNLLQASKERNILLERSSCSVFSDSRETKSATELLKSSLEGYTERKTSEMIGLISFNDVNNDLSSHQNGIDERKLLVIVIVKEEQETDVVWMQTSGGATVKVKVTPENLPALIHDIYFDILIANSLPIKNAFKNFDPDIIYREKVNFCSKKQLKSYFGKLENNAEYVSIVSCFRRSSSIKDIDWHNALKTWEQFVSLSGEDLPKLTVDELVYQIRRGHLKGGNISPTALSKAISMLVPHKSYYLLLTEKRPKKEKDRYRIRISLKKSSWRQNMWLIIPVNEISKFDWHLMNGYLSSYKFIR